MKKAGMPLFVLLLLVCASLDAAPAKKLIEWGGDSPTAHQFRERIETLEKSPFDGTVITAIGKDGVKEINLAWEAFGPRAFKREQFSEAVKDLQAAKPKRFTDCFLRFN